jgi:outer membrane protein assembly factor BamB
MGNPSSRTFLLLTAALAGCAAAAPGALPTSLPADSGGSWPIFRGDAALTGLAAGKIPDRPVLRWKFRAGESVKSSPVIAAGKVFVGSDDANVHALDLARGTKLWSYKTDQAVQASPCLVQDSVYVGSDDGNLYCLGMDGSLKWKYKTGDRILGSANYFRVRDSKAEGGWSGRIIVGSYDKNLYCLDAQKGQVKWTYQTKNWINGAPAVCGDKIVFGGCDAVVHVVSADDGTPLAAIDAGSYIAASAALAGNEAYVGNYSGKLLRVDTRAGKIVWSYGDGESSFFSSPAVAADRVVVGCQDRAVHCVSRKDGTKLWTFATGGAVDSSPVICGGKVVVGSDDGQVYMLSLSDGSKVWSHALGGRVTGSPAVADGMIIVGCEDGLVYAFGPQEASVQKTPDKKSQE